MNIVSKEYRKDFYKTHMELLLMNNTWLIIKITWDRVKENLKKKIVRINKFESIARILSKIKHREKNDWKKLNQASTSSKKYQMFNVHITGVPEREKEWTEKKGKRV